MPHALDAITISQTKNDTRHEFAAVSDSDCQKLAREGALALSACAGIGDEFVATIKHPEVRLLEAGAALAINAGLNVLTRGEFGGIAHAIELGLGASFVKQLLSSSGNVVAAGYDAWKSPANMDRNKATVASSVGNFVIDGGAFVLGGALGSKFVGEPLTNRLWSHRSSPGEPLPAQSSTFNISYDSPLKPVRTADLADPQAVNSELRSLLGYTKPLDVNGTSVALGTRYGTAKLEPYYSRQSNLLSLDLRSPSSLRPVSMEFSLDRQGMPRSVTVTNDDQHFLPTLFERNGYSNLARAIGNPTKGDFALAEKFGKLDWASANARLQALKAAAGTTAIENAAMEHAVMGHGSPASAVHVPERSVHVAQKSAVVGPIGVALSTTDLMTCSGLAVIDKAAGKQLLAHVDHVTNPDLLAEALGSFDLSKSEIYLMEGEGNAVSAQGKLMGSAERALSALGDDAEILSKVHFVSSDSNSMLIQTGKVYAPI